MSSAPAWRAWPRRCRWPQAGRQVVIHEAGPAAGGRCRSYFDRGLSMRIDNGNHLLLSGNAATMAFLDQIGARHTLGGPGTALFPFIDLATGERWTVSPGRRPHSVVAAATARGASPAPGLRDNLALLPLLPGAAATRPSPRCCATARCTAGCWSRWRWRR